MKKPTKSEKLNLSRSMSFEAWQHLCGFVRFLDALDSNIELARTMAEDYHHAKAGMAPAWNWNV